MKATKRFSPERLKAARGDRRHEELAAAAGRAVNTIKNWERGVGEPDASDLLAIASLCGRSLDYFFEPESAVKVRA